jgi:hypothetical protein
MVVTELEHYVVFPAARRSGADLLVTRHAVIQWAVTAGITIQEHYVADEYRVSLARPRDYTQFVLQWTGPADYWIVGRQLLTGEPLI